MIRGIHHPAILTGDLEGASAFYRDLPVFRIVLDLAWPPGTDAADHIAGLQASSARVVMLRAENAFIELFQYVSPPRQPGDPRAECAITASRNFVCM